MTAPLRIMVTGGRDYADFGHVCFVLGQYDISELCHGSARGLDTLAERWAYMTHTRAVPFPADWEGPCRETCQPGHRRYRTSGTSYCPAAGVYRNQRMVDEFKPDLGIAFRGGTGTADAASRLTVARIKVVHV